MQGTTSARKLTFPLVTLTDQKCSICGQPAPCAKPATGLLTPNKVDYVTPANQVFSICLFLVLDSLSSKSFFPATPHCMSPVGNFMKC